MLAWSPCGNYQFTGGLYDGVIRVWRVADWSLVGWAQGQEYSRQIEALAISKDNILAAGGDEGMVYLFKFSAPAEKPPIRQTGSDLICIEGEDFDVSLSQGGHWWSAVDDDWVWETQTKAKKAATVEIKQAGPATLNVWMREDGMEIDKFILTKDETYTPAELGPEPNPRGAIQSVD